MLKKFIGAKVTKEIGGLIFEAQPLPQCELAGLMKPNISVYQLGKALFPYVLTDIQGFDCEYTYKDVLGVQRKVLAPSTLSLIGEEAIELGLWLVEIHTLTEEEEKN